jgi:hypothetical protein
MHLERKLIRMKIYRKKHFGEVLLHRKIFYIYVTYGIQNLR